MRPRRMPADRAGKPASESPAALASMRLAAERKPAGPGRPNGMGASQTDPAPRAFALPHQERKWQKLLKRLLLQSANERAIGLRDLRWVDGRRLPE